MKPRKRQKTDPSPVKPHQTLLHFFSKGLFGGNAKVAHSPPRSDSDSGSVNGELPRKSDINDFENMSVKCEMTPPPLQADDTSLEGKPMQFEASFTELDDNCSPTKEEEIEIDPFDQVDFRDDEVQDEDFREYDLEFPYEGIDDIEDDSDVSLRAKQGQSDTSVDDGPSCPLCNFSFRGLTENVSPSIIKLMIAHHTSCEPLSRQHPQNSPAKVPPVDSQTPSTPTRRHNLHRLCLL